MKKNLYLDNLEKLEFRLPNIVYETFDGLEVFESEQQVILSVDGVSWMVLNLIDFREVYEFFSHVSLSKGKILCSGMGLLLRESWLINKGFDVTVVEYNKDVINYHLKNNSEICSKLTIIHDDIHNIVGKYDTVLLDHYEHESQYEILEDVINLMNKISCDVLWFWPLERFIENHHYRKSGGWEFYQYLRKIIPSLPDIPQEQLFDFLEKYYLYRGTKFLPYKIN
jgi:hypothetical protein